jgi:Fur family transcriptional regulator, zinc uptake regulator
MSRSHAESAKPEGEPSSSRDGSERHDQCDAKMRFAEQLCRDRGLSFTALRREVYALICEHASPLGAYELLDLLKRTRPNAAPVTVYRALEFLVAAGLVHKLAALNAFTACHGHAPGHGGLLLVCRRCSNVIELEDRRLERTISQTAADRRFATSSDPVEVRGLCEDCQQPDASAR